MSNKGKSCAPKVVESYGVYQGVTSGIRANVFDDVKTYQHEQPYATVVEMGEDIAKGLSNEWLGSGLFNDY